MKKFEFFELFLRDDGIVQVYLYPNTTVLGDHVRKMVDAMLELTNGKQAPVLMFIGEFATFTKEAREYSADPTKERASSAIAYVIDNLGQRLVINFFIKINKPTKPIKMFTNEKQAVDWLKAIKN